MYLIDSVEDYRLDMKAKKFNALAASFPEKNIVDIKYEAKRVFRDSITSMKVQFASLVSLPTRVFSQSKELPTPNLRELLDSLLFRQLQHRGENLFMAAEQKPSESTDGKTEKAPVVSEGGGSTGPPQQDNNRPKKKSRWHETLSKMDDSPQKLQDSL